MYKDPDKQREANRLAQAKFKAKGITKRQGITGDIVIPDQEFTRLLAADVGGGFVRVSKPGDADYVPQCETTRAFVENRPKRPLTGKRGKDIKCFADLPPDVQSTINTISDDKTEHKRRTAIAINYQHLFPERYESTGMGTMAQAKRVGFGSSKY